MVDYYDGFKLRAGNNEPIWHEMIPSTGYHTLAWGEGEGAGSSAIKGNDGVSAQTLHIFLWLSLSFFKFRLAKNLEKQTKNRYFDVTAFNSQI